MFSNDLLLLEKTHQLKKVIPAYPVLGLVTVTLTIMAFNAI